MITLIGVMCKHSNVYSRDVLIIPFLLGISGITGICTITNKRLKIEVWRIIYFSQQKLGNHNKKFFRFNVKQNETKHFVKNFSCFSPANHLNMSVIKGYDE